MTLVKICGICDAEAARTAVQAGADLIGLQFCSSRRHISPEQGRSIVESLDPLLRFAPPPPARGRGHAWRPQVVGVFIDQPEAEVEEVANYVGLDLVQLHGSEPPGFRSPRPLIKALKVRDGVIPGDQRWPGTILLDSWSADQRGGTGQVWNWEAARDLVARRQVILAGGLTPGNVGELVRSMRPHGVDVSSGVESAVRTKDPELVRAFVQAVREVDARER